jgi:hypothetical protein
MFNPFKRSVSNDANTPTFMQCVGRTAFSTHLRAGSSLQVSLCGVKVYRDFKFVTPQTIILALPHQTSDSFYCTSCVTAATGLSREQIFGEKVS